MDTTRAEELFSHLADVVDLPPYDESDRLLLSRTLAITSLQFAAAARRLCESHLAQGAAAVLRSQFEALVRGTWVYYRASDNQVQNLSSDLSIETQRANKNAPHVAEMLGELKKSPQLANLLISLGEFKDSSWLPLNSFVHSGIHAVHWTRIEPPRELFDQIFRGSNGLAVLAFQHLAMLTGKPKLQNDVIAVCATYSGCLPARRT